MSAIPGGLAKLPSPAERYDATNEREFRRVVERALGDLGLALMRTTGSEQFGRGAQAKVDNATAIGRQVVVGGDSSVGVGAGAQVIAPYQFGVGGTFVQSPKTVQGTGLDNSDFAGAAPAWFTTRVLGKVWDFTAAPDTPDSIPVPVRGLVAQAGSYVSGGGGVNPSAVHPINYTTEIAQGGFNLEGDYDFDTAAVPAGNPNYLVLAAIYSANQLFPNPAPLISGARVEVRLYNTGQVRILKYVPDFTVVGDASTTVDARPIGTFALRLSGGVFQAVVDDVVVLSVSEDFFDDMTGGGTGLPSNQFTSLAFASNARDIANSTAGYLRQVRVNDSSYQTAALLQGHIEETLLGWSGHFDDDDDLTQSFASPSSAQIIRPSTAPYTPTSRAGVDLKLRGGRGRGNALGGAVIVQVYRKRATADGLRQSTVVDVVKVEDSKVTVFGQINAQGYAGFPAFMFSDQDDGQVALRGATGERGPAGASIALPVPGEDGEASFIPGARGPAGSAGVVAFFPGEDGEDAIPLPGARGADGAAGAAGADGSPGAAGMTTILEGEDGQDAIPLPGPQGEPGPPGALVYLAGDEGEAGFPFPGPRGEIGETGAAGADGAPGAAGMTTILDGEDGQDGLTIQGERGERGTPGALIYLAGDEGEAGFPFPGPRGETGATGATGPAGASGGGGVMLLVETSDDPVPHYQTIPRRGYPAQMGYN